MQLFFLYFFFHFLFHHIRCLFFIKNYEASMILLRYKRAREKTFKLKNKDRKNMKKKQVAARKKQHISFYVLKCWYLQHLKIIKRKNNKYIYVCCFLFCYLTFNTLICMFVTLCNKQLTKFQYPATYFCTYVGLGKNISKNY